MGPWSAKQRKKFRETMMRKKAAKEKAHNVVHIPAEAIEAIGAKNGFVARREPSQEMSLDVKVGSEMTVSIGGMTLRLRAVP